MGLLFSLLLVVLGMLVAEDFLSAKQPAMRKVYDVLNPYADYLGCAGLVCGLIWILDGFTFLRYFPMHSMAIWGLSVLMLAHGLILSLDYARKLFIDPSSTFILKIAHWRDALLPYRKELGIAAIVLGLIYILF